MKIYYDFKVYNKESFFPMAFFNASFHINILFRISSLFVKLKLFPIAKVFWLINRIIFSVDIDPRAKIAGGFEIIHGIGIVIGKYVEILGPVKIYQGATLGGNNNKTYNYEGKVLRQPLLYPNVTVGINSAIIGPLVIGENATIGTNAVVTKNVAKNSIIIGNNKILKNE